MQWTLFYARKETKATWTSILEATMPITSMEKGAEEKMGLETKYRNMVLKIFQLIRSLFIVSVSEQYKGEF